MRSKRRGYLSLKRGRKERRKFLFPIICSSRHQYSNHFQRKGVFPLNHFSFFFWYTSALLKRLAIIEHKDLQVCLPKYSFEQPPSAELPTVYLRNYKLWECIRLMNPRKLVYDWQREYSKEKSLLKSLILEKSHDFGQWSLLQVCTCFIVISPWCRPLCCFRLVTLTRSSHLSNSLWYLWLLILT
jgi:hypothetical protein